MDTTGSNRGFRLIDLLVLVVIFAAFTGCLFPAISASREAGRRASCQNRVHQIGLAMQNFASTFNNCYPPPASVTKAADGTQTVGGWSLTVRLLSFMDEDVLYRTLPRNGDPEDTSNQATVTAMNTQLKELLCPSGPRGSTQQNSAAGSQTAGITNYKAVGASSRDSLAMVANPRAKPPYGTMEEHPEHPGAAPLHPDGAIYPSTGNLPAADIRDGLSHTIFIIETIDEAASRWTVGKEATLVGLPQKSSPKGTTPQAPYNYFAPRL